MDSHRKDKIHQVNTLVYCMGNAADDILCSLGLSDDEKKVYEMVKTKLRNHFIKWRNVVFKCCKFNQRKQEGKSVNSFITLYMDSWNTAIIELFKAK